MIILDMIVVCDKRRGISEEERNLNNSYNQCFNMVHTTLSKILCMDFQQIAIKEIRETENLLSSQVTFNEVDLLESWISKTNEPHIKEILNVYIEIYQKINGHRYLNASSPEAEELRKYQYKKYIEMYTKFSNEELAEFYIFAIKNAKEHLSNFFKQKCELLILEIERNHKFIYFKEQTQKIKDKNQIILLLNKFLENNILPTENNNNKESILKTNQLRHSINFVKALLLFYHQNHWSNELDEQKARFAFYSKILTFLAQDTQWKDTIQTVLSQNNNKK